MVAAALFALVPVVGCHVHAVAAGNERAEREAAVDRALQDRAQEIEAAFFGGGEALAALRDLFDASEEVTPEEFWLFAERARKRHPGMLAIAWSPLQRAPDGGDGALELLPAVHVTPDAWAPWLARTGAAAHQREEGALLRAAATGEPVVGEAGSVPADLVGKPLAEVWLMTGLASAAGPDAARPGLLQAVVDLGAAAVRGDRNGADFDLVPERVPRPPTTAARPVLDGRWSLRLHAAAVARFGLPSWHPLWRGVAAGGAWSLFTALLLCAGAALRREVHCRQSMLMERVMASLADGVVVADRRGRLLACNEAATRLLTPPPAGDDVRDWFAAAQLLDPATGDMDPPGRSALDLALAGLPAEEVERTPAGGQVPARWLSLAAHPLLTAAGQRDGAVIVVRDGSARHRQIERLEQLSRAVEQTADMVMITGRDGAVVYVNPAFTELTGHAREDVIGAPDFLRRSQLYGAEDLARLRRHVVHGERFSGPVVCRRKDGTTFATEQTITPLLDDAGRLTHIVVVCKDLTTQNQLLANEVELQIAAAVQQRFFPRATPAVPGLDIAGATIPATATSGDLYDWVVRPDGRLALAIGDASGHGLGPALLVAQVHAFLRCMLAMPMPLAAVLRRVHELLVPELPDGGFVTLLLVEIDPQTRRLQWVNAGHEPGLLLAPGRQPARLTTTGPALGVLDAAALHVLQEGLHLEDDDLLVLITDGITEHLLPTGDRLGEAGLLARLAAAPARTAAAIVAGLGDGLRVAHGAGTERDDATIVVVRGQRRN